MIPRTTRSVGSRSGHEGGGAAPLWATSENSLTVRLDLAWREDDDSPLLRNLLKVLEKNEMFLEGLEEAT